MNDKVACAIETLSKYFYQTCSDVDNFMKDIFDWSEGVEEILKNECLAKAGGPGNILPVIHSERKTNNKNTRNNLISTTSVLNAAEHEIKNTTLNETRSRKTRAAQMAHSKKTLQLNDTKDKSEFFNVTVKKEISITANGIIASNNTFVMSQTRLTRSKLNAAENVTNETFIVPQIASTRTKPVVKKKKEKNEGNVKERGEDDEVLKYSDEGFQSNSQNEMIIAREFETFSKTPNEKENSRSQNKSFVERTERVKVSRTLSKSPVRRPSKISKTRHESFTKTPTTNVSESYKENVSLKSSEILVTPKPDANLHKTYNRNETFSNKNGSEKRNNTLKLSESLNNSPILQPNGTIVPDTPNSSPLLRSSSLKDYKPSDKSTASTKMSEGKSKKISRPKNSSKENNSTVNGTLEKKESSGNAATFLVSEVKEKEMSFGESEKKISPLLREKFKGFSKTSTPVPHKKQKITSFDDKSDENNTENSKEMDFGANEICDKMTSEYSNSDSMKTKKNKKKAKQEASKDKVDDAAPTVRITRTKSKALQQMMEKPEIKQLNELSVFAKKIVNKAKKTSLRKNQISALMEKNFITPSKPTILMSSELYSSKSKYHLLLSSSKKAKTPLATLPNSVVKIVKSSVDKTRVKPKIARRDSSAENLEQEREEKLKSKQKKEEEAAAKRQNVIKNKQEELKRKNERKHQLAMKQREKLEQEKYKNMIQSEKEKEERHKLILKERQMKMKEEAFKKKMLTQQKIAETNERRRLEEEARIAKLKEMEAEEQRIALEKQKEQEMLEKRAQERLAQKKAREEYEIQLKKELEAERMKAEKLDKKKLQSASKPQPSKRQKFEFFNEKKEEWDYKPRNEDDYGLEHEESVIDSEDESSYKKNVKSPVPWVKKILKNSKHYSHMISLDMLCEYMYCIQKTPDLNKMFNITPTKRIKRNSSAIWNTPSS